LTKATDRLPALSGLAKVFQQRLGNYIAGLCLKDLPLWLTWSVIHRSSFEESQSAIPSWPWTSIPSGHQIYYYIFKTLGPHPTDTPQVKIEINDVSYTLATSGLTGTIQSGALIATAPTVMATYTESFMPVILWV
jgi:hypothetical protein